MKVGVCFKSGGVEICALYYLRYESDVDPFSSRLHWTVWQVMWFFKWYVLGPGRWGSAKG